MREGARVSRTEEENKQKRKSEWNGWKYADRHTAEDSKEKQAEGGISERWVALGRSVIISRR